MCGDPNQITLSSLIRINLSILMLVEGTRGGDVVILLFKLFKRQFLPLLHIGVPFPGYLTSMYV